MKTFNIVLFNENAVTEKFSVANYLIVALFFTLKCLIVKFQVAFLNGYKFNNSIIYIPTRGGAMDGDWSSDVLQIWVKLGEMHESSSPVHEYRDLWYRDPWYRDPWLRQYIANRRPLLFIIIILFFIIFTLYQ